MRVFVDESGDAGLKIEAGSSPYFVVALVIFEDMDEAQSADGRITLLRRELRVHPRFEFHFSKCRKDFRVRFLEAVAPCEFFYHGIVINKAQLWSHGFQCKESIYKYASGLVFENAKEVLTEATVIIDGSGSREFQRQLQTYLKRRINDPGQRSIDKVKVQDSSRNNLVQLVDMVAGAIHRSFSSKEDATLYRSIVSHREMRVQLWPK